MADSDHEAWLHAPVVARRPRGWMHGQVVQVRGRDLVIVPGHDAPTMTCRASVCTRVEPVLCLLLSGAILPPSLSLTDVEAAHATVLSRLLGDGMRASRDIPTLLKDVVTEEDMPYHTSLRLWVAPPERQQYAFKLQHAVDYVFVHESSAKRISRAVRDGVGEQFYQPPPKDPPKKRSSVKAESSSDDEAEATTATTEPPRKRSTRR